LKALAPRWSGVAPVGHPAATNPFAGAEDLNPPGLTAQRGVLFMEGEPAEIKEMKRDLEPASQDSRRQSASASPRQ
jgi:hypothetical protein